MAIQAHGSSGSTVDLENVAFVDVAGMAICERAKSSVRLGPNLVYANAGATTPVTQPLPQCAFY